MLIAERESRVLLGRLKAFEPEAVVPKWIDRAETYKRGRAI